MDVVREERRAGGEERVGKIKGITNSQKEARGEMDMDMEEKERETTGKYPFVSLWRVWHPITQTSFRLRSFSTSS